MKILELELDLSSNSVSNAYCVTIDKSLNLSHAQFFHLQNGGNNSRGRKRNNGKREQ